MKIKSFFISICSALIVFACTSDNVINDDQNFLSETADNAYKKVSHKFDYTVYNNYKDNIINTLNLVKNSNLTSNIEGFQNALDIINTQHDSNLELNSFDYDLLNSKHLNWEDFYLEGNYLNNDEVSFIKDFSSDAENRGFNFAIEKLKEKILTLDISEEKFAQYNLLINTLMISNDYFNSQTNLLGKPSWWGAAGCGVAIAANAVSTYALTACVVPNPLSPEACAVAGVAKVLSFAGVILGCA